MDHDRLDMLKHISFINEKNLNLFKNYIPNHYDEIYSLFSLLQDANIDYHDIKFDKPKEEKDDKFIFLFSTKSKIVRALCKYLEENNNIINFMRNKDFNVILPDNEDKTKSLIFKRC